MAVTIEKSNDIYSNPAWKMLNSNEWNPSGCTFSATTYDPPQIYFDKGNCEFTESFTQDEIRAMLPLLTHFAEHGNLPSPS